MPTLALTHGSKLEVAINIVQNAKLFTDTLCGAFLILPIGTGADNQNGNLRWHLP